MVQHGGLVFYGGLIGAFVTGIGYLLLEKTAGVENCRRPGAEHRAGKRFWADRLPAQWLLLWPRVPPAVGHHLPSRGHETHPDGRRACPYTRRRFTMRCSICCSISAWRGCSAARNSTARSSRFIWSAMPSAVLSWNFSGAIIRRTTFTPGCFTLGPTLERADFRRGHGCLDLVLAPRRPPKQATRG